MQETQRAGMVSFLCSMARHGRLDKAMAKESAPKWPVGLGRQLINRPNMKFRSIGFREAVFFLSRIIDVDIGPWFKGPVKLEQDIAVKAANCFN